MQFWTRIAESPRVVVDFATNKFFDQLPWALAAMAISIAGIIVAYIFIKIAEWLTRSSANERWLYDAKQRKKFLSRHNKSRRSFIRLVAMSLAILSVLFGFWIGATTAGFNFWTLILGYGIVGIVLTYGFGTMLKSAGAFFLISLSDKIEEEWVVSLGANNVKGRIKGIHILWVELELLSDLEKGMGNPSAETAPPMEIQVPTWQFLDAIVWRDMEAEARIADKIDRLNVTGKVPTKPHHVLF